MRYGTKGVLHSLVTSELTSQPFPIFLAHDSIDFSIERQFYLPRPRCRILYHLLTCSQEGWISHC